MFGDWFVYATIAAMVLALVSGVRTAAAFGTVALVFMAAGYITPQRFAANLGHPIITILALLVIISGTLVKAPLLQKFAGRLSASRYALRWNTLAAGLLSGFLNNTGIVATLMSTVSTFRPQAAHQWLLPISYAAMMGGTLTVIGGATNLYVAATFAERGLGTISMFDFLLIGFALLVCGLLYLWWAAPRLLPEQGGTPVNKPARQNSAAAASDDAGKSAPSTNTDKYAIAGRQRVLLPDFARRRGSSLVALGFALAIVASAMQLYHLLGGLLLVFALGLILRAITLKDIADRLPLELLSVVLASLAIAEIVASTGLPQLLGNLLQSAGASEFLVLFLLYLVTVMLTELMTNIAAVSLVLPVALQVAAQLGISPLAVAFTAAYASNASYLTPYGHQTNLMVYEIGKYRFADYIRLGGGLALINMLVVLALVPVLL